MVKISAIIINSILLYNLLVSASAQAENEKIIAVGASVTSIISSLGLESQLIAVDTTSLDANPNLSGLANVGYHRNLAAEGLLSLKPDIIIGTTEMGPKSVINQFKMSNAKLIELQPAHSIDDLESNINLITKHLPQVSDQAMHLINKINLENSKFESQKSNLKNKNTLFLLSHGKGAPKAAGKNTTANALIKSLGLTNAAAIFNGYRIVSSESILAMNPEVILVLDTASRPIDKTHLANMLPGIESTTAIKLNQLSTVSGASISGGYGIDIIAEMTRILTNIQAGDANRQSTSVSDFIFPLNFLGNRNPTLSQ